MQYNLVTPDVVVPDFGARVARLSDPRSSRGIRHDLSSVIATCVCALLAGRDTYAAVSRWAADAPGEIAEALRFRLIDTPVGRFFIAPSYSTINRLVTLLCPDGLAELAACVRADPGTEAHVKLDGKRLRGSRRGKDKVLLVAAVDAARQVMGQIRADDGDEIGAARHLIATLDLEHVMVSLDALHTQVETAEAILKAGADYALTVKGNQPGLLAQVKALPWASIPNDHTERDTAHGRAETRTIKIFDLGGAAGVDFPGAVQAVRIRRWRKDIVTGKIEHHVVFGLVSRDARAARAAEVARWFRCHWQVEVMHWIRDVVFGEDAAQIRAGHGPENTASLRNLVITVIGQLGAQGITALRDHIANHPYTEPLRLLGIADLEQKFERTRL